MCKISIYKETRLKKTLVGNAALVYRKEKTFEDVKK